MNEAPSKSSLYRNRPDRRAMVIAFVMPLLFTVTFFFVYRPAPSNGPDPFVTWPPACVTIAGYLAWLFVVSAIIRALRTVRFRLPAVIAVMLAVAFFLELLLAAAAIAKRPL